MNQGRVGNEFPAIITLVIQISGKPSPQLHCYLIFFTPHLFSNPLVEHIWPWISMHSIPMYSISNKHALSGASYLLYCDFLLSPDISLCSWYHQSVHHFIPTSIGAWMEILTKILYTWYLEFFFFFFNHNEYKCKIFVW